MGARREFAPGEWAVLALLAEQPSHGWALSTELSRSGGVGRVWSVGRPVVYRALDALRAEGLVEAVGEERGDRGPQRTIFSPTATGREALAAWLVEPVEHVREARSLLLLKLVLLERSSLTSRPLLEAQRAAVLPVLESLGRRLGESAGAESIVVRFRLETTRATLAFVEGLLAERAPGYGSPVSGS